MRDPLGVGARRPRLSWSLAGPAGRVAVAYRVVAAGWDSGRVEGIGPADWDGPPLRSGQRVQWQVEVWDDAGAVETSEPAWWEMGLLDAGDWWADWIARPADWPGGPDRPPPIFRRTFELAEPVERARLYATALGLYEAWLNGVRVGNDRFTPGWTDYRARVQYQTYDVADLLLRGRNVLEIEAADGWYAGWVGFVGQREHYGSEPEVRAQLVVEHRETTTRVGTGEGWKVATGPRRAADLLMGEIIDAGHTAGPWFPARVSSGTDVPLVPPVGPPTRAIEERTPVGEHDVADARIVDFGQNLVGWARVETTGAAGDRVEVRFAEMLDADGTLYVDNLRSARATDTFLLAGTGGPEIFEPSFTFHGFRYAELKGAAASVRAARVTAVVAHADLEPVGAFSCSDEDLNRLQDNIVWGMRGNFVEVPTDCPQRDERLGWLGDAQVFAPTACFNYDVAAFLAKWMTDVIDGQSAEGAFPDVAPKVVDPQDGAPGWGDAGVIVPWVHWQHYGDERLLAQWFPAMAAWVDYIDRANPSGLWLERRNGDMGDWLSIGADSPKAVVATSFFFRSADLVTRVATALGREAEAARCREVTERVRDAYLAAYLDDTGRIEGGTQTVYALALRFGILPEPQRAAAAAHLAADVVARGHHLTTGFLGVAHLLPALSDHGHDDVAYRVARQTSFPSWLYPVHHGATTIWERWDGWTEDGGFQDPAMNSFNHYAFGAVGEWLYGYVAGLRPDPHRPGLAGVLVEPHFGSDLDWARAAHRGYEVEWRRFGSRVDVEVAVPAGGHALVRLVGRPPESVGSGAHRFRVEGC